MNIATGGNILFLRCMEGYQGTILAQLTFFHIQEIWLLSKPDFMYYTDILKLFWCLSPHLINYMDFQLDQWDRNNDECICLFVEQISTVF